MSIRVLFDTNVVSYWLRGSEQFQPRLKKVLGDLRRKKAAKFISVITTQEMEVWARHGKQLDQLRQFLSAQFSPPLIFDALCAREAARLAALVPRDSGGTTKAERREITDRWHRDASIAATAHQHGLDQLVTANGKDFSPFSEHISCEIVDVGED